MSFLQGTQTSQGLGTASEKPARTSEHVQQLPILESVGRSHKLKAFPACASGLSFESDLQEQGVSVPVSPTTCPQTLSVRRPSGTSDG